MITFSGRKVEIGDKLKLPLKMDKGTEMLECEVVWIHPQKRFFRVKFELHGKAIYQSYSFYGPIDT